MKRWLRNSIYLILIFIIVFVGNQLLDNSKINETGKYITSLHRNNIVTIIQYGSIGALLGFKILINEMNKNGSIKINIPKLVLLGIPSILISFSTNIFLLMGDGVKNNTLLRFETFLTTNTVLITVFQVVLGYTLITCFYKE
ncbi:MAG: hypothetical protein AB6733_16660 [Clostridiaceae bacterium]